MTTFDKMLAPYTVPPPAKYQLPRVRKFRGRCFELAGKFALDNPDAIVVHGIVVGWIGHAWVEIDGLVYDGTARGMFALADYYRTMEAQPVRKFERQEYLNWMVTVGQWRPCDELTKTGAAVRA